MRLLGVREQNGDNYQASRAQTSLDASEQVALQIEAITDQVERIRRNLKLAEFQICRPRIDCQAFRTGLLAQKFDGDGGTIYRCYVPTQAGQIERVPAKPAGQIQGPARCEMLSEPLD